MLLKKPTMFMSVEWCVCLNLFNIHICVSTQAKLPFYIYRLL